MSRLVKERDVMLAVQKAIIELGYEPLGDKQGKIYEAIENTPTASDWIPCSERLPDEYGEFLCCDKYGEYIIGYPVARVSSDDFYVETEHEIMNACIAWQPLPAPYKEGE